VPSSCPKCHRVLTDDTICCADVRYTWKCRECGKLSQGFVVPYGKCYLCGGTFDVVPDDAGAIIDIDQDGDIDMADMAVFQRAYTF